MDSRPDGGAVGRAVAEDGREVHEARALQELSGTRFKLGHGAILSHAAILLALLVLALAAPAPATARVASRLPLGVDVSRFNGVINWEKVAGAGIEFAFVQASRGNGSDCTVEPDRCGRDRHYATNYRRARKAGIRVGAYHRAFAEGDTAREARADARHEAEVFIREVGSVRRGDLLPVLDVEQPYRGLTSYRLRIWIHAWLAKVERRLGPKPMIYTSVHGWGPTRDRGGFALAGHPLWVANWGVRYPAVPAANWAGRGWSVWQFTSEGRVNGIDGNVDKDRLGVPFNTITIGR